MKIKNDKFFIILRQYLQVYLVKNKSCSTNTIKAYTDSLNLFFKYLEEEFQVALPKVDWTDFSYERILGFLVWLEEKRGCSKQTQNQRLTAIRSFVRYAGIIDTANMAVQAEVEKIKVKKTHQRLIPFLTPEELKILLQQPDIAKRNGLRDMVFLTLMYDTAARCQEMVDLKLSDIDLKKGCVYITGKGDKTRAVPIMPKTAEHIRRYIDKFHPMSERNPNDHLFYTVSHGERHRMSEDNVAAFVKKYGEAAKAVSPGIPDKVHPHMLRHTRAMHLYQGGMPMPLLSDFLGHANMDTTKIYAYADTNMKREAIRKANSVNPASIPEAIWKNDDEMLRILSGLK